jgi:hypothetical protein
LRSAVFASRHRDSFNPNNHLFQPP